MTVRHSLSLFFFFNDTATTEIYTLSLHDALPISRRRRGLQSDARQGALRPVRAAARPRDGDLERLPRGDRRRGGAVWRRRCLFDRRARSEAPRLRPGPPGPLLPAPQSPLRPPAPTPC